MITVITNNVTQAAEVLAGGGVIGMPTETVYGLAGSACIERAIEDIYALKGRPKSNPLILHIGHAAQLESIVKYVPQSAYALAGAFWPGPLTLVLDKNPDVSSDVTSGLETVAVRMPAHPVALQLLKETGFPVAAPSANPFGRVSPTSSEHVLDYFQGKIPLILEGGRCRIGIESTIVGFRGEMPVLYRKGAISAGEIKHITGALSVQLFVDRVPQAPGMFSRHYSPVSPMLVSSDIRESLAEHKGKRIGVIRFAELGNEGSAFQIVLSPKGSFEEAAAGLYNALHEMDRNNPDIIIAEKFPDTGLGTVINDKLTRAAHG